jgi:hypothetical protein
VDNYGEALRANRTPIRSLVASALSDREGIHIRFAGAVCVDASPIEFAEPADSAVMAALATHEVRPPWMRR